MSVMAHRVQHRHDQVITAGSEVGTASCRQHSGTGWHKDHHTREQTAGTGCMTVAAGASGGMTRRPRCGHETFVSAVNQTTAKDVAGALHTTGAAVSYESVTMCTTSHNVNACCASIEDHDAMLQVPISKRPDCMHDAGQAA